jgi:uncharacterized membrane protein YqjE
MTIQTLQELITAWVKLTQQQLQLFTLEAKLARYSIMPFLVLLLAFIIISIAVCIFTLITLCYYLYHFTQNILLSLGIIEIVSLVCLILVAKWLYVFFKQLQFPQTRHYLKSKLHAEQVHEEK